MRKRVREPLFSVVKGRTGLCRFFCRTGRLLICPGWGREGGEMAEQRTGGKKKRNAGTRGRRDGASTRREKDKKVGGTDAVLDSWEEWMMKEKRYGAGINAQRKRGRNVQRAVQSQVWTSSICPKTSPWGATDHVRVQKRGGKGRRERRAGGEIEGYKRDGEGKGVERRHRGDWGERSLRNY